MKKFKLVSLIILMSMVFSTLIPLKVRAVDTNKIITAKNFNAFYLLTIVAHAGAGNLSVEEFNTAAKNHFVDIDELSKTETVIKYSGEKFPEFSNDILDTTDVYLADQYTAFFFAGEMDSSVLKDLNDWAIKKKADLGISEEITKFSTEIEIIGKNGTKLSSTISKDGGTALLGEKKDFKNESDVKEALAKLGINMVNVPEQVDIIGNGKLFDVGSKMTPVEQFYYNLGINDAAVLWKLNVNDKSFYMVYGYEKTNSGKYNCNVYLVTDKTLDPVPDDNKFETELNYEAFIGTKDVGGKTEDGTFMPSYDETNIKEDADVTATISSKNKEEIVKVNDKEVTDTPSKDQPWYYPNPEDKTKVAKQYPFDTYDNSTDNGMVSEKVTLTSSDDKTSEQNVSIKWPFRIIDKTYDPETPTDDTKEVTITIETNLPMDPDKVPEGWTIVPDTDNHKISKTYKKGDKVDEDVTVYQNKTGNSDKTHVKYTWPGEQTDKSVANKAFSQTGEKVSLALIIAVIAIVAAIVINKKKNNLTK